MEINQYDSGSMHDSAGKEEEEESSSESSECDESRPEEQIREMKIILRQKDQEIKELKVIREKKEELETENSSLKEKLKSMKAEKKRFEKRAELYQKKAEDVKKKMKEEMVTLEEKNDDLEDFKRRKHPFLLQPAVKDRPEPAREQSSIASFMRDKKKYDANDPRQKRITDAITSFVAGTLQSLSIVEAEDFRDMIATVDPRAVVPSRKHLSSKLLEKNSGEIREKLMKAFDKVSRLSLAIDIWSNRQLRSYIGITVHFIINWKLHTALLTCKRFTGRHTADNIVAQYEEVINNFCITQKVSNIITDNASNMMKAFTFPGVQLLHQSDPESESGSDSETDLESDEAASDTELEETLLRYLPQHDACFAHTLQLVVKDGMKEIGSLHTLMSKVSSLVSHIRKSTHATDLLRDHRRVQAANATRWNSEIKMIRSVLQIPQDKLDQLDLDKAHKLTLYERNCLQDLCDIFVPFEEVTDITQGDKSVTCSFVVPCIRGLRVQMNEMHSRFNNKLVSALRKSIDKRLSIYEDKVLYKLAAILDPRFKLAWCKESEVQELQNVLTKEAESLLKENNQDKGQEDSPGTSMMLPPPVKKSGLFSYMTFSAAATSGSTSQCSQTQKASSWEITSYLSGPCLPEDTDPLRFWEENQASMPTLSKLALNYLVVPATSAPVERVFSVAGRIFKPDRCQLSDKTFQTLVFIKYNKSLKF